MKLDAEQMESHLARGLAALYVITGDEQLLALEAADAIRARARAAGFVERETFTVETGFNWPRLLEAGQSLSLFSAQRIIDLRIPTGKPGVEGAQILQRYAERLPQDVLTLITLPRLDKSTQSSAWFMALAAQGVLVQADPIGVERLAGWLQQRLKRQGQEADAQTLDFIVDRVQGNLLAAHQEVLKMGLLFGAGKLAFQAVSEAVVDVARFDVFQLGEAILGADRARFVRMLDGLRAEGTAGPLVLYSIVEEIRALKRVQELLQGGRPLVQALREARVWGARARLLPGALGRLDPRQLDECLLKAATVDRALKGVDAVDPWDQMLSLGLKLMPRPAATARERVRAR